MHRGATPNAFILGVPKAGTTSLARYLGSHPDVFVPETKEPNHYLLRVHPHNAVGPAPERVIEFMLQRFSVSDVEGFTNLYAPGASCSVRIDASVRYLYHPEALEEIARDQPGARHIVVLRDPAERALSHWRMNRGYHLEPLGFADALAAEDERVAAGWGWDWHYRRVGTYAPQLRELFRLISRDQVLVLFYGDFLRDPRGTLGTCFEHMGVRADVDVDMSKSYLLPSQPRWAMLHRMLLHPTKVRSLVRKLPAGAWVSDHVQRLNAQPVRPVHPEVLEELRQGCEADLEALAELLDMSSPTLLARMASRAPV